LPADCGGSVAPSELDRSSKVDDEPIRFFEYACEGFVDGLREQLNVIKEQQLRLTWEKYVQDQFHDRHSPAIERLKHILIDMPAEFISRKEIMSVSARVTRDYAIKSEKTLTRDLNSLLGKNLINRSGNSYKPNHELIRAFLPPKSPIQTLS
jgi:cell filamentation protein, protein adenylyltransferase